MRVYLSFTLLPLEVVSYSLLSAIADLGTWRSPRYRLGKPYIKEYLKHVPISEPVEDFDDRNALYAMYVTA